MAMTLTLKELGYSIEAAHCNFRLRGDEAERDENFCIRLCQQRGIRIHLAHFDTREYAACHKEGIETAARELRYDYLRQLKNDINASAICVAHNSDDSAETLIINLIRGTGIEGLGGIRPVNGDIVRPMLCVSRKEIESFLKEKNQTYVNDSSNLVNDNIRNKIRIDVIPLLETINPSVKECLSRTAFHVSEAIKVLRNTMLTSIPDIVMREADRIIIDIEKLKNQPSPEYTLHFILKDCKFPSAQIAEIWENIDAQTGTEYANGTHRLVFDRGAIIVECIEDEANINILLPEDGTYAVGSSIRIKMERIRRTADFKIAADSNVCFIDARNVKLPLHLRTITVGDRFVPFGMNGSKLVSDFLTDRKMNIFDRRRQLIVTDDRGTTLWLVGIRSDNRFRITPATTDIICLEKLSNPV